MAPWATAFTATWAPAFMAPWANFHDSLSPSLTDKFPLLKSCDIEKKATKNELTYLSLPRPPVLLPVLATTLLPLEDLADT